MPVPQPGLTSANLVGIVGFRLARCRLNGRPPCPGDAVGRIQVLRRFGKP